MNTETTYENLLSMPQWIMKRKEILQRDNHQCRSCGNKTVLQVHHRQYQKIKATNLFVAPWQYANHLLVTLCENCHKAGHEKYTIPTKTI